MRISFFSWGVPKSGISRRGVVRFTHQKLPKNRNQPKTATTIRIYLFCFQVEKMARWSPCEEGVSNCILNTEEIQRTKLNHKKNLSLKIFSIFYHIYVDFMIKIFFQKIIQILDWINYRLQSFIRKWVFYNFVPDPQDDNDQ